MAETFAPGGAGLQTRTAAVPLTGVAIDAEVSAFCARVVVTQRYVNDEPHPIEATYLFPLDEGAAVCGFEAVVDGTLVVGEVHEREEAFRRYDEAMEQGHGAYLLDEERPDVFQANVGNLPPGKDVLLRLTYVTELGVDGRGLRFSIPTTVAPRYAPAEDRRGVGRSDEAALSAPLAWDVPYGLALSVRLAMSGAITRVESPSHPIAVSTSGPAGTVTLSQREAALDRDIVIAIEADGLDAPAAWVERQEDGTAALALGFVPALPASQAPGDVVFVVDCSGSMGGRAISETRDALQLCLRSLTPGCTFNLVAFGSDYATLFPQSRAYDDASLAKASAWVASLDANRGGTEILEPLRLALHGAGSDGPPRQVVVLTDGEVTNTDAVLALAREFRDVARIFTFGVGASASQHLVKGLARAGGGACELIHPGERIEPKVLGQLARLLSPALYRVRVDWGAPVRQASTDLPPVFGGSRLVAYGLALGDLAAPFTATLTAETAEGPVSFAVPVDPGTAVAGRTVATLAARARIRELEESPEWTTARGSRQRDRKPAAVTAEIIELATRYGLMSRETSYVAIERRATPVQGDVQLRRIPIALSTGWGGLQRDLMSQLRLSVRWTGSLPGGGPNLFGAALRYARAANANEDDDGADEMSSASLVAPSRPAPGSNRIGRLFGRGRRSGDSGPDGSAANRQLQALIVLQHADGSWDLDRRFAEALDQPIQRLEGELTLEERISPVSRATWATSLAVAWLRQHVAEREAEWRLIADKAARYLSRQQAPDGRRWRDRAEALLGRRHA